ncbi:TIGR02646 family protein [Bacillus sp. DNRA2]|uniref:retron system putative HNH endonuclease n=1 Tax=Bacillus sp. DNRA2 TaxID=2723053 RepID=UPI00145F35E4|nr:retron system putative HNH endonuclease [Bacillus sp. DNRA2]NMD68765.1 TIGR02646 family protein [Bacillus sp. DNRA2]
MKHIHKKPSPSAFEHWKSSAGPQASYTTIPPSIKAIVRQSLLDEQFWLCCYCGLSLTRNNVHIEHFRPQSKFKSLQLDYQNLHASCMGKLIHHEAELSDFCGHSKKDWFDPVLMVSPLDPDCESYFEYGFDGTIRAANHHRGAEETIHRLGLNTYLPRKQREEAINAILDIIDLSDTDQIKLMIRFLETPDETNRLPSFSFVIARLLKSLLTVDSAALT